MNSQVKVDKLNMIVNILVEEKNQHMVHMNRIKNIIRLKTESVNRIIDYRNDYHKKSIGSVSSTVPALMMNMQAFIQRLNDAIAQETAHIQVQEQEKVKVIGILGKVEIKIKSIEFRITHLSHEINILNRENEHNELDELTSISKLRDKT